MMIEHQLHRRFAAVPLLGLLLLGLASAVSALVDPICPGGIPTGAMVTNDNGSRAPFSFNFCDQRPIVHAYALGEWVPPAAMWLGANHCECDATTNEGASLECNLGLRPGPPPNANPSGLMFSWCGQNAGICSAEDGVVASYGPSTTGQRQVRFDIHYHVAAPAQQPIILLRVAQPWNLLPDELFPVLPGDGSVWRKLNLYDGYWDVQVTLYDKLDCLRTLSISNELYAGGETENYELCVGDHCILDPLRPLRSNH